MVILHEPPSSVSNPPPMSLKPQFVNESPETGAGEKVHENEWYQSVFSSNGYKIQEQPLHTRRPMHLIIVGAGAAGLQIAYKALRQLRDVKFTIYEKNSDVGGTWLENRYPGCTCDIPSHSYQFSFRRKPDWKSYYAGAEEIRQYLKSFAVDNDLEKFVKFRHKIEEAVWDQEDGVWKLKGQRDDGSEFHDQGEMLASCHGVLKYVLFDQLLALDANRTARGSTPTFQG